MEALRTQNSQNPTEPKSANNSTQHFALRPNSYSPHLDEDRHLQQALAASLKDHVTSVTSQDANVNINNTVAPSGGGGVKRGEVFENDVEGLELALKMSMSEHVEEERRRRENIEELNRKEKEELERILQLSLAEK